MMIELTSEVREALLAQAELAHPRECCGIMLGHGNRIAEIVATDNVHPAPETHFEIDPQALVDCHRAARGGGPEILGYYHSHPNGLARPSATDMSMAAPDGSIWAIIAAGRVSFWRIGDAGFEALPYETCGR